MLNLATGEGSVVVGGVANSASGDESVAVAGVSNRVNGDQAMAASSRSNRVDGNLGLAAGGSDNTVASVEAPSSGLPADSNSVVLGGSRNTVHYVGNALIGGTCSSLALPHSLVRFSA